MTTQEIHQQLTAQFGDSIGPLSEGVDPACVVATEVIADVCRWLHDQPGMELTSLMCLSATDDKTKLGVTYNLHSMRHRHRITLKIELADRNAPHVPSVAVVFGTADWHEREAYDMMGIVFDDHPDLRRILCPEDWEGWPLRKDYVVQEYYRGLRVPYPEGRDLDRGHWVSRDVPDRRAVPPDTHEPDLTGI
ncbi:MAG: NADH-quinone oxidoreductase subunit C [Candidatus Zixiibacteriota bacterium]